jgi:hypothetical protein
MSDCIKGAFGQALEVRGLDCKDKRVRTLNFRPPFTNIPLQQGRFPRFTRAAWLYAGSLQWDTPSYLPLPRIGIFSEPVPQILPPWNRSY